MIRLARSQGPPAAWNIPLSHQLVAVSVVVALLVSEYEGPIVAISASIAVVTMACLCSADDLGLRFASPAAWLLGILSVGCTGAVVADLAGTVAPSADVQRDLGMILSYALFFIIAFSLARRRQSYFLVLSSVLAVGAIISLVQLVKLAKVLSSGVSDLYLLRLDAGRGSITQFAALCAAYCLYRGLTAPRLRTWIIVASTLIATSIVTTLSRGLLLFIVVLILGTSAVVIGDRSRVRVSIGRGSTAVAGSLAAITCGYFVLAFISPATTDFIDSSFVARLTNSLTEVSTTNLQSRNQVIENYRAYELDRALSQYSLQPDVAKIIGQGWGTSVQFDFDTASTTSSFKRTSAAFLHNGYAYYLTKTGIVGLALYIGFMIHLAYRALRSEGWSASEATASQRKVLLVVTIGLALGTITTGGLGFPVSYLGLTLVAGACLQRETFATSAESVWQEAPRSFQPRRTARASTRSNASTNQCVARSMHQ